ncbi:hypothetical protein OPT61_g8397 [Boeremia exigua]|uniref:Uncharacterized protein n=1 Tax=Boeremia exigua TaxID=749465 RepID=A0ACC2HYG6_9PLEO|nr:hypothetical protein OPT61_g8397 [Boeremia exigua]
MKTRTAPAQLVQPLACWPERLEGAVLRIDTLLRCPPTPNGCRNTTRPAELSAERRCREGRRGGDALSGGCGDARPCVAFDDRARLAATLASRTPISHSAVQQAGERSAYPPNR